MCTQRVQFVRAVRQASYDTKIEVVIFGKDCPRCFRYIPPLLTSQWIEANYLVDEEELNTSDFPFRAEMMSLAARVFHNMLPLHFRVTLRDGWTVEPVNVTRRL